MTDTKKPDKKRERKDVIIEAPAVSVQIKTK